MPTKQNITKLKLIHLLILLLCSSSLVTAQKNDLPKAPQLEQAACRVPIPKGVSGECYNLTVPESRRRQNSRTIVLPVVIIKSTSSKPSPDPVIYTAGGPGVGSLGMVRGAANLVPYTKDRDFIIFEQRGTQYAEPNLQCPEVNEALHKNRELNRSPKNSAKAEIGAAKTCRDRLSKMGVDLGVYNSSESAADMDDLRNLLGIKKWNLYGISYSTRLMINYVREYPNKVRSIILDSVLPPTANWDETGIENVVGSLDLIFNACSEDKSCSVKYADLKNTFNRTIKDLDRSPAKVDAVIDGKKVPVKLIGRDFVDLIYNLLESTGSLQAIPWTIDAISKHNYEPLKAYAENALTSSGFIWGMRYSVWCTEEMPFQSQRKISEMVKRYPNLRGFSIQGTFPQICKVWNVPAAEPVENDMVRIPVPVLVFGGEFDPDTPPDWGQKVASWSEKGYFFKVKSTSHQAMGRRCTFAEMPIAFLNDPDTKPDSGCLNDIETIRFK